jgi:hypothetical protein
MANVNKVVFAGTTIIDLTADTIAADKVLAGFTAHDASGAVLTGTCDYDSNTQDATVKVAEIIEGQTAYARGAKLTGTMLNNGSVALTIDTRDGSVSVPQGYHDGGGAVTIAEVEKAKLIAENIKQGITIMGIEGTLAPGYGIKVQSKNVTPAKDAQTVLPDSGYDYLSQVDVAAIPYTEAPNAAGGVTATIA